MNTFTSLARRVLNAVGCGRVKTGNDSGNVQMLQVQLSTNEIKDNTPRLAEFGFTSMPPAGSDAIILFIGSDRSQGAVIATGHQASRPKGLQPGEAMLYNQFGMSIYLTQAGIVIDGGGHPVTVIGDVIADGISLKNHVHSGVSTGLSNTGGPV
jgi:phage baseplate assembly protein V